jgi:hypothetical protein
MHDSGDVENWLELLLHALAAGLQQHNALP